MGEVDDLLEFVRQADKESRAPAGSQDAIVEPTPAAEAIALFIPCNDRNEDQGWCRSEVARDAGLLGDSSGA